MKKLSLIFVGTGAFGVKTLEALYRDNRFEIPLVVTGLDKEVGRGLTKKYSDIKVTALANKLIVQETENISVIKDKIVQLRPDFLVVVAFGEIIKKDILAIPKFGSINIHGSLLPKYRGASPIHTAILRGDRETGITWILMNEKMDAGDILSQAKSPLFDEDNFESLFGKLADLSAEKTGDVLFNFAKNGEKNAQENSGVSYCKKIEKKDGLIEPSRESAEEISRKIRAYNPWPGAYLFISGKRLNITKAAIGEQIISAGKTRVENGELIIGTTKGALIPLRVKPESKKEMSIGDYLRGQREIMKTK